MALPWLSILPDRVARRLLWQRAGLNESMLAGYRVSIAKSARDLEACVLLLHRAYLGQGILLPGTPMRVPPHLRARYSVTLVAHCGDEVVGTMSFVPDGQAGLPVEDAFPEELASLRQRTRRLAEVGAFAIAPAHRHSGVAFLLIKGTIHCARELIGIDDFAIAVHPRARAFYCTGLGFREFGPVRGYPGFTARALALPLHLDLRGAPARFARVFAGWPEDERNPHHMYFQRIHPQIALPSGPLPLELARLRRLDAVARIERQLADGSSEVLAHAQGQA
jgi:hypothetical protein